MGCGEDVGAAGLDGGGAAVVDVGGGVQAQPRMSMIFVVVGEEFLAVGPGGLDGVEPAGEVGPVLEGLEIGLWSRCCRC